MKSCRPESSGGAPYPRRWGRDGGQEAVPRKGWPLGVKFCISVRSMSWTDSLNPSTLKHYGFDVFSFINTSDL